MADNRPWVRARLGESLLRRARPAAAIVDTAPNACPIGAESAESPHCIALQVATVRYIVEEKRPVTCDDAKTPWSGEGRYLLCKQGVAGSSPVVSTAKVLVTGPFRFAYLKHA